MAPADPNQNPNANDFSHLFSATIGASIGGLVLLIFYPSWRPYWYIVMLGGAASGALAYNFLDLNDRLTRRRNPPDKGQASATFQSCLLAFLIFAIIFALCIVGVFFFHRK